MNTNKTIKALPWVISMVAAATFFAAASARSAIIEFDALPGSSDDLVLLTSYAEDGFFIESSSIDPQFANDALGSWGSNIDNYNGSRALFNVYTAVTPDDAQVTRMTRPDAIPFNMFTIDLGPLLASELSGGSVIFIGEKFSGATVAQTFTYTGGTLAPQRFSFSTDFIGLKSLSWEQSAPFHQFDNIAAAPIPEPGTFLMIAIGAGGLLMVRRRQRRS